MKQFALTYKLLLAFVITIPFISHSQVNLNSGLVAYFPFNGNTNDASGNSNNATNFGATLTQDQWGNPNSAYLFNGTSDYMQIANNPTLQSSSFTFCVRVKPLSFYNGVCFNNVIIAKGNSAGYGVGDKALTYTPTLNQNPANYCSLQDSTHENYRVYAGANGAANSLSCINAVNGVPYINSNNWDCVVGVFNDTTHTATVYVNGAFRYSYLVANSIGSNASDIFLGKQTAAGYPYWMNAVLDEVRIYNRTLNTLEIDSICNFNPNQPIILDTIIANYGIFYPNICDSLSVQFNDSSTAINSTITNWNWNFGDGNTSTIQNPSHTYNLAGNYLVTLIVTNNLNNSDTFFTNVLAVNSSPSVSANASPNIMCINNPTILTGSGASTYSWTGGIIDGVPFSPNTTSTYTVTGTDAYGCTATSAVIVTVNPLPNVIANAAPQTICSGNPTALSGSGASTYNWSGGITNGVAFTPLTNNTYTVTGTDANGCSNTSIISIAIVSNPIVSANVIPSNLCQGASATFNGSGASSYSWNGGVTNGVPFTPNTSSIYTVTGSDANGCTATSTVSVNVNSLPLVSASANPSIVCVNNPTTLTGSGAITYSWTGGVTNGLSFTPNATSTYTVTGSDANGCTGTSSVMVNVITSVPVSVSNTKPTLCIGDSSLLTATGASTYSWFPSIGLNSTNTSNVWANPNTPTTYTVIASDANGCTGSATTFVDVIQSIDVNASKNRDVECNNHTIVLSASGAQNYAWTPANILSNPNDNITNATVNQTTTFYVTGNTGTCVDIDSVTVYSFNNDESSIFIPNAFSPNGDGLNDCFKIKNVANFKNYYFAIFNRWGERVFESESPEFCWEGNYKNEPALVGTYYYYLKAETICGKILKKGDIILMR